MGNELTSDDVAYYGMFPDQMEADGITPEMLSAVSQAPVEPAASEDETAYEAWLADQERKAKISRDAIRNEQGQTTPFPDLGTLDFMTAIEAQRQQTLRQTEAAVPVAAADSLTKQDLYGKKPRVGVVDRIQASFQDVIGSVTNSTTELSEEQMALEDLPAAVETWEQRAQEIYSQTGVLQEDGPNKGQRIYTAFEVDPLDPTKLKAIDYVIPKYTSNMWANLPLTAVNTKLVPMPMT